MERRNDGRTERWSVGISDGSSKAHTFLTFPRSVVQTFTTHQNLAPGSSRALGWDTPDFRSSSGSLLSPHSIGHTGFTGTSLWIDFDRRVAIVLLSNRVHPTRNNPRWNPVRAGVADLVMTTLFEDVR